MHFSCSESSLLFLKHLKIEISKIELSKIEILKIKLSKIEISKFQVSKLNCCSICSIGNNQSHIGSQEGNTESRILWKKTG